MVLALALLAFQTAAAPAPQEPNPCNSVTRYVWDPKFKPGQKWAYHSRPTDVGSTVTISEIDSLPGTGIVVHVVVDHLDPHLGSPTPSMNYPRVGTERFAINRDSLDASVTEMLDNVRIPDPGGYAYWLAHCLAETHATTVADTLSFFDFERCEQDLRREQQLKLPHRSSLPCRVEADPQIPSPVPAKPQPTSSPALPTPSATPKSIAAAPSPRP